MCDMPVEGRALVVLPTYNERDNLEPIVLSIHSALPGADILVVDDASPDETGVLADELAQRWPYLRVLHRASERGLGTAYLAGFAFALREGYDFVFEMDADFSHNPNDLPRLLQRAQQGADLVIGSRYVAGGETRNWSACRRWLSRAATMYARTVLRVSLRDLTAGFKCFRRQALEQLDLGKVRTQGYGFQIELTYQALQRGLRVEEIPIVFVDRRVGKSKMTFGIAFEAVWKVWRMRFGGGR